MENLPLISEPQLTRSGTENQQEVSVGKFDFFPLKSDKADEKLNLSIIFF